MPKNKVQEKSVKRDLTIKPLMGYVVVEPSEPETRTASGLYLPETAQERPAQGKVIAVSESLVIDGRTISVPVKVGDKVIYKKWGGDEIKLNGKELKVVKFEDLMAVIED